MLRGAHLGAPCGRPHRLQALANPLDRIVGVECHDQVDEIVALEADRFIAIRGRDAQRRVAALDLRQRRAQMLRGIYVAAGGDENAGHAG
jgi:hypothetical protein